jgi:hypothetical protein
MIHGTRILTLTLTCAACTTLAAAQTPPAFTRDDDSSSLRPRAIAFADFDRDGFLDIAHGGGAPDASIVITLNRTRTGAGFERFRQITVGGGPFDMAAGDLNRDGWPDLAIANADAHAVTLLISSGVAGSFRQVEYPMPGANPRGIALGDRDRDGALDVLVTEYATGAWRILYGNGTGSIVREERYGAIANPQGIVAADFNRDGWLDVAIAGAGVNIVAVFYSTSTGGLQQKNVLVEGAVNVLAQGDFNRDGWLDLAAVSTSNSMIYTLLGASGGLAWRGSTPSGSSPRGIAAGDVNHDGWVDLMTANRASSTVNVHLGMASNPGFFTGPQSFAAGSGSRAIAAGDFDHDGRTDLATANEFAGSVSVLLNSTDLVAAGYALRRNLPFGTRPFPYQNALDFVVANFDRAGGPDVAVLMGQEIVVRYDTGVVVRVADSSNVNQLGSADFNRDGLPDLMTTNGQWINVYLRTGATGFTRKTGFSFNKPIVAFAVGDFTRDGRVDLAAGWLDQSTWPYTTGVHVAAGNGDGTFRSLGDASLPRWPTGMAVADLNRDGQQDLVTSHSSDAGIHVLYGDGAGGWSGSASLEHSGGSDVAVGDVNEDGRPDIVTTNYGGSVVVFVALPEGGFAVPVSHEAVGECGWDTGGCYFLTIDLGDFDADGHLDVLTTEGEVLLGRGDGTFELALFDPGDPGWGMRARFADYNGDALLDIVTGSLDLVSVGLNQRSENNLPPTVRADDRTARYEDQGEENSYLSASGSDPDLHQLTYEWRNENGTLVGRTTVFHPMFVPPGRHTFTVTAYDGRGGQASDTMIYTVLPYKEVVMHATDAWPLGGAWRSEQDPSAADSYRVRHPDAGAPKLDTALASPVNYIDVGFIADPTQTYKLWIRGKADGNSWANDSVHIQFSGAVDVNGNPVAPIGTTSALVFNLEECSGCGVSGWGWEDDGWGAKDRPGILIRFPEGRSQRIRLQTREDGLSIDQIVLSAEKYLTSRPGLPKNDTTIVPRTPWP